MVGAPHRSLAGSARRGGRYPMGAPTVAVGPAGRLRCDARATRAAACPGACKRQGVRQACDSPQGTVTRPGSLPPFAALNAPRTSRRPRRSVACGAGLPLAALRFSPPHKSPPPGTAHRAVALVVRVDTYHGGAGKAAAGYAPAATLRGAEGECGRARVPADSRSPHEPARPAGRAVERRAEAGARAARASTSDSPRLSERNDRRECSEFRGAASGRAPQGSRPAGPTAVHERRRIPGRGFASLSLPNARANTSPPPQRRTPR